MAVAEMTTLTGDVLRQQLKRDTVGVYGFGRTGQAVVDALLELGSDVRVFEDDPEGAVTESWPDEIDWSFEDHNVSDLDRLITSPGVPEDVETVREAKRRGIVHWGEVELAERLRESGRLWTVTGTNGKSTCVELMGACLEVMRSSPVSVCGNRGTPFIEAVMDGTDYRDYVVEISSFQVEGMRLFQPDAVLLTNLGDDHLDRHGSLEAYHDLKWELVERVKPAGNVGIPLASADRDLSTIDADQVLEVSSREVWGGSFQLQWRDEGLRVGDEVVDHEQVPVSLRMFPQNMLSVFGMVLDRPDRGIVEGALGRFDPLPHRAELMEETGNLRVIEDSKATNPDAVEQLIHSIEGPFRLLLGGEGKDADFGPLFHALNGADLSGLGVCGSLEDTLMTHAEEQGIEYERFDDWETAVKEIVRGADTGETVVLSPGGTSFDAFEDYKKRGEHFQQWVRETVGR